MAERSQRRATRTTRRLAELRERNAEQTKKVRARERRIDQALRSWIQATERLDAVERTCHEKVVELKRKIDRVRADAEHRATAARDAQAAAVMAIHDAGRTGDQVSELLGLSRKARLRLMQRARVLAAHDDGDGQRGPDSREDSVRRSGPDLVPGPLS